jgi:hypothetical protein
VKYEAAKRTTKHFSVGPCSRPVSVVLLLSVVFLFHGQCFTLAHTNPFDGVVFWMYDAAPLTQYYSPRRTIPSSRVFEASNKGWIFWQVTINIQKIHAKT